MVARPAGCALGTKSNVEPMKTNTLAPEPLDASGNDWRAANSLSVGQLDALVACLRWVGPELR